MPKLFMLLLGCKPKGRHTEQHDIFFTISDSLQHCIPDIKIFWPDAGTIHIDSWREVTESEGYSIEVVPAASKYKEKLTLFFLNLGGYKPDEFEEYHYKMIIAAENKTIAIKKAKESAFYKHTGFKGAASHIDDKYGIDVDDLYNIEDILPESIKKNYRLRISENKSPLKDKWHIGYTNLTKLTSEIVNKKSKK